MEQFEKFSLFLNNLEEFTAAVRLYATAEIPVSQREFIRAVRASTSYELDEHLVCLIYRIFDTNNDNRLSYSEFIAVMNDRLHRGLKVRSYITYCFICPILVLAYTRESYITYCFTCPTLIFAYIGGRNLIRHIII